MALSGRVILFTKTLLKNGIKRNGLVFPSGKRLFRSLRPVGVFFAEKKNYLPSVCNYSTDQLELLEESVLTKRWLPEDELLSLIEGFANKSSIPTCLYPESSDPILQAIISSTTTEQVFSLCSSLQHLNHEQASQALCSLWDLHHLIGSNLNPQPGIQENLVAQQLNSFIQVILSYFVQRQSSHLLLLCWFDICSLILIEYYNTTAYRISKNSGYAGEIGCC